jgi:hypothetical protein
MLQFHQLSSFWQEDLQSFNQSEYIIGPAETTEQIWTKLGRNVHWEVLYQLCYFGADRKSNMAVKANNVFSLVETLKIFLSDTTQPMELLHYRNDDWVVKEHSYNAKY